MKEIYVANWKMNGTKQDVENYVEILSHHLFLKTVILAFPFVYLECAKKLFSPCLKLGAQNLHQNSKGAHTGDISGAMLKDIGCEYVIIGHSERRASGDDTNVLISQKLGQAFENDLIPILCIGETGAQRDAGQTHNILYKQLEEAFPAPVSKHFIVAYEPVWAIGTGKVPTLQEISAACTFIHNYLEEREFSEIPILYGGSVIPENVYHLKTCAHVSGFLVGGASLKAESFLNIIQS